MTDLTYRNDIVVQLRDNMGGDESIIEAMLVSSDNDHLVREVMEIPKTAGRIRFLMRGRHGTPFEHNAVKFYVEAPIFVFREWHRHRIGWSYNEQSGRYSELPPMFYIPPPERNLQQVGKPGAYTYVPGTPEQYDWLVGDIKAQAESAYASYQERLNRGIAKEVARMSLPVNIYSKMYATCNARSLMAFISLRTQREAFWQEADLPGQPEGVVWTQNPDGAVYPSSPMWEIAQAGDAAEQALATLFPLTYDAFSEFGRVAP